MGNIKVDTGKLLEFANQMRDLQYELDFVIRDIEGIEDNLNLIRDVNTYDQRKKIDETISFAQSISRNLDDFSYNLYHVAKTYEETEERLANSLQAMFKGSFGTLGLVPIPGMEALIDTDNQSETEDEKEGNLEKYRKHARDAWNFFAGPSILNLDNIEFFKNVFNWLDKKVDEELEIREQVNKGIDENNPFSIFVKSVNGIEDAKLKFGKEMTIGLASDTLNFISSEVNGLLNDPIKTLKGNGESIYTLISVLQPITPEQHKIQEDVANSIWENVKKNFDKEVAKGDSYTRTKYVTDMILNIAALFAGGGEVKALSSTSKVEKVIESEKILKNVKVLEGIDVASDANKLAKIKKEIEAMKDVILATKFGKEKELSEIILKTDPFERFKEINKGINGVNKGSKVEKAVESEKVLKNAKGLEGTDAMKESALANKIKKEKELSESILKTNPLERAKEINKSVHDIKNIKNDVGDLSVKVEESKKVKDVVGDSEKTIDVTETSYVKSIEKYTDEMRKYIIPPEDGFDALIERRYIEIRKASFDDVSTVSKNTGLSEQDVIDMKEHLFLNTHDLSVKGKPPEKLYFQGNANIAYGWGKAQNGELTDLEKEWFKQLRNHELTEKKYMDEGMPLTDQSTWDPVEGQMINPSKNAHDKANLTAKAPDDFPGYPDIASREWNKNYMNDSNDY
ncbi:hypothetical protein NNC19_09595 [Clostridium sp. SHJSY1]|uniref:hypothetical protein n=1 Tax=Clostridium sp. SHJSY1 TaxID=2942483 RepID=UPI002875BF31|nr:hypothetical protein [Clostridium sp. SHJSY1]MDS0525930.1 hypothetical protein [Clostridium sp. SHJSY1]